VQPFIRYEVGDVVTLARESCRCGSLLPRIERIEGRASEVFRFWNGSDYQEVLGSAVKNACDYLHDAREWQALQAEQNLLLVRVEPLPGAAFDAEKARHVLKQQLELFGLPRGVAIEVEVVPRLMPDPVTGKFRRIVPLESDRTRPAQERDRAFAEQQSPGSKSRRLPKPAQEATVTPASPH
jgi:phenylacetate-coenzyme A ligase PaaK-like adenylate-forming protein